jgi:hypothetical protein
MKKQLIFLSFLFATVEIFAQATKPPMVKVENLPNLGYRQVSNQAFKAGESVQYRIHYGMVNAGLATLSVEESPYKFDGREAYHVVGKGQSLGSFDWFFKVRDHYETYIDKQGIFPYRFIRNCDEGGYKINQDYTFHPEKRAYKDAKGNGYMTPDFVQDMLSSFYYARSIDYSHAKKGDIYTIMTVVDDEIYPLKMKYIGKEQVKVDIGTFNCLKFAPVIQKGRVFKKEDDLSVWITDDGNHLPILVKAKILFGSIKMELSQYSGISHPLAQVTQ